MAQLERHHMCLLPKFTAIERWGVIQANASGMFKS